MATHGVVVGQDKDSTKLIIAARALDKYFEQRVKQIEGKDEVEIDPRLTSIVERMLERSAVACKPPPLYSMQPSHINSSGIASSLLELTKHTYPFRRRCIEHGHSEQAIGVAIEARRLDKLEEVIGRSEDTVKAIKYSLGVSQKLVVNRTFRQQVLRLVIRLYEGVPKPDYVDVCQCLMFLDDDKEVANILNKLLRGSLVSDDGVERGCYGNGGADWPVISRQEVSDIIPIQIHLQGEELLAYQISFDLVENEMQSFLIRVGGWAEDCAVSVLVAQNGMTQMV